MLSNAVTPANAATRPKPTVTSLRHAIAWQHSVIVDREGKLAIAYGRAGGGRATPPVCHTNESCGRVLAQQKHARLWAEGAWQRLQHDASPSGFRRIIVFQFHRCGAVETEHALATAWYENHDVINAEPSPTDDYGGWQINKPAHARAFGSTDASFFHVVLDPWLSTEVAVRWSGCGHHFSPTWNAATNHGIA